MASIYDLKPKFQALLRPVCRALAGAGVTANQVTIAAFALSAGHGAWIALSGGSSSSLLLLPVTLFIRMALNAIDGMLAREFGQKSKLGAVLNELTDVAGDAALYLPFAAIAGVDSVALTALVIIGILAEMTGVIAVQIGASRRYDGPFGKSDRAFFFGALGLFLGGGIAAGMWTTILLWAGVGAGVITIVNRARAALRESTAGSNNG